MKTPKPTRYDCTLFMLSHSLLQPTADQRIQKRHRSTDDGGQHYLVKQVDKDINGDTFDVTLLCTDVALWTDIRIRIPADCVELSGMHTEEKEQEQEAQEVLSECLSKAQKIEVTMYYPADKECNYLGSMYLDGQILGDMLLKESCSGEEDL